MPFENKSNVSPYVSLGRLRLVQKLLTQETYGDKKKPLDAIFCAIGEDSDYSDGSLDLVHGYRCISCHKTEIMLPACCIGFSLTN